MGPVDKIVTAMRDGRRRCVVVCRSRFDEQINGMFVPPVNERDDCLAMEIIESPAHERKTLGRQITHFGSEIDLAIETTVSRCAGRTRPHRPDASRGGSACGSRPTHRRSHCARRAWFGRNEELRSKSANAAPVASTSQGERRRSRPGFPLQGRDVRFFLRLAGAR